jgi:CRISPR-associated protein Csb1
LGVKKLTNIIFKSATEQWTLEPGKGGKGEKYGKSGSPADINHGNIPPTITDVEKGEPGGVTFREARQTAVLSFAQLRKLKFPLNGNSSSDVDVAGRAVLAALGIYAMALQIEDGYQLRSRCQLQPVNTPKFEWIEATAAELSEPVSISSEEARQALEKLCSHAEGLGLVWEKVPLKLEPEPKLLKLVEKSDKAVETVEE